jgi:tetratricopeptide (TPR) repeat protein
MRPGSCERASSACAGHRVIGDEPSGSRWRTARVFISSTFLDMQAERDHLVRDVMPRLRERLERHRIHLIDVDLRWGVTRAEVENRRALDVCLAWVRASQPFFLGLLGRRYGYVVERVPEEHRAAVAGSPAADAGVSITELEVRFGGFVPGSRPVFAFRADAAVDGIPEPLRSTSYVEAAAGRRRRLEDLKAAIRGRGAALIDGYACAWDPDAIDPSSGTAGRLVGLDAFGRDIERCLWDAIAGHFELSPDPPPADGDDDDDDGWLAVEDSDQERFIELHLRALRGREEVTRAAVGLCAGGRSGLYAVVGPSGIGKSTILASVTAVLRRDHPELEVVAHFLGAGRRSTDPVQLLQRLCRRIAALYELETSIPDDVNGLSDTLARLLASVPPGRRLIVVLDGLDQIDAAGLAEQLGWLPEQFPEGICVLASCADDRPPPSTVWSALQRRAAELLSIEPLARGDRRAILESLPSLTAKTLDEDQQERLLDNPATGNPLFLQIAIDELRGLGSPVRLNERIDQLPRGEAALAELLSQVFDRLEARFGGDLPRRALSAIACARHGLTEAELEALVAAGPARGDLFAMLRQLRSYLVWRGPLIDYYHDAVRRAVVERYLPAAATRRAVHEQLANFFFTAPLRRQSVELFWQLRQTEDWARLYLVLTHRDLFLAMRRRDYTSILECWSAIERFTPLRLVDAYPRIRGQGLVTEEIHLLVINLLKTLGHLDHALRMQQGAVAQFREAEEPAELAIALAALADLECDAGSFGDAAVHLEEAERLMNLDGPPGSAFLLLTRAKLSAVLGASREALHAATRAGDLAEHVSQRASSLSHMADALKHHALPEALEMIRRSAAVSLRAGDMLGVGMSKNTEGQILRELGDLNAAWECHEMQLAICERFAHRQGVALALAGKANVAFYRNDLDQALELHEAERRAFERIGDRAGAVRSACSVARIQLRRNEADAALALVTEQIALARAMNYRPALAFALAVQGDAFLAVDREPDAARSFREAELLEDEMGNSHRAAQNADARANALRLDGRPGESLAVMRASEAIFRQARRPRPLCVNLLNQCAIHVQDLRDPDSGRGLLAEAEQLASRHGFADLLPTVSALKDMV